MPTMPTVLDDAEDADDAYDADDGDNVDDADSTDDADTYGGDHGGAAVFYFGNASDLSHRIAGMTAGRRPVIRLDL